MGECMQEHVNSLLTLGTLSAMEFTELLRFRNAETTSYLFQKASEIRTHHFGKGVYLWGRIPFSNFCKYDCKYCGLQRSNQFAKRYRLSESDILSCCHEAYRHGVRNFLLESGVDLYYTEERLAHVVSEIHKHFSDCGIILSVGERTKAAYTHWLHAGATHCLISPETVDELHYKRLHPSNMSLLKCKQCLWEVQEAGYQTGIGLLLGTPFQTMEQVAEDLLFTKQFVPQMVQIAPFLPAVHTPFERERNGNGEMVLYIMAMLRLMLPAALIIAETSLEQTMREARVKSLDAGANVIVVDITSEKVMEKYQVYRKRSIRRDHVGDNLLTASIRNAGYQVETHHC